MQLETRDGERFLPSYELVCMIKISGGRGALVKATTFWGLDGGDMTESFSLLYCTCGTLFLFELIVIYLLLYFHQHWNVQLDRKYWKYVYVKCYLSSITMVASPSLKCVLFSPKTHISFCSNNIFERCKSMSLAPSSHVGNYIQKMLLNCLVQTSFTAFSLQSWSLKSFFEKRFKNSHIYSLHVDAFFIRVGLNWQLYYLSCLFSFYFNEAWLPK